jgi:hypothetical protein
VLSSLDRLNLTVTANTISERRLRELRVEIEEKTDVNGSDLLDSRLAEQVHDAASGLRETLVAEAQSLEAFIITGLRLDSRKLLEAVPSLLAPGVFESLPTIAQYDFREAGKCIAFSRPTAAAFHIMRGTEDTLRLMYTQVYKRGRIKRLMWAPMVEHMRKKTRAPKPPVDLLDELDMLRQNYRNPTQHPEAVYDMDMCQDLLPLAFGTVNKTMRFLSDSGLYPTTDVDEEVEP